MLADGVARLEELQEKLYASELGRANRAAGHGKVSLIKHAKTRGCRKGSTDSTSGAIASKASAPSSGISRNGTLIMKFFLNVSRKEQRQRFLDRVDLPTKRWKFSTNDVNERKLWPKYMAAYEDLIRNTSTPESPWYVLPADHKWFTRLAAAAALVESLDRLKLDYPKVGGRALVDARITRFHRMARDFERYATTIAALIRLVIIRIMLRRLTKPCLST